MAGKKVAIMGAGSIGTILGARLTMGGVDVVLIDSFKEHVDALNKNGATVVGGWEFNTPVKAITPDQMEGIYDYVFLICKQTGTKTALEQLMPHLGPDSTVITLQNGRPEVHVAEIIGEERTCGGIVLFPATWEAPGVSRITTPAEYNETATVLEVGEIDGSITPRILEIQEILSHMGHTAVTQSLMSTRWFKVCVNSTQSGISAVCGTNYGGIMDRQDAMKATAHVMNEAVRVAHASGAKDLEYLENWYFHDEYDATYISKCMYDRWLSSAPMKASMLQDLEKGKPCEIDFINGEVSTAGKKLGIPTPYCDAFIAIIKAAQSRKTVWTPDEACAFLRPLLTLDGETF